MYWSEDELDDAPEIEKRPRDSKIDQCKGVLVRFMEENRLSVFYIRQLQVLFERQFYHWITGRAISELVEDGGVGREDVVLAKGKARFVFHKSHRYRARQISRAVSAIERYSDTEIARACGHWAETLFLVALAEHGFRIHARNSNRWGEKEWTETKHNLDFIVGRDDVVYGVEVKNTWDYIPRAELRVKLKMCDFLGSSPCSSGDSRRRRICTR